MVRKHRLNPASICDLGCGTGGVLDRLSRELPPETRLVGYEISPQAIALAPPERKDRITIVNRDRPDQHFDLLLMLDVFEHVDDYLGFLRSMSARAERFIFHIPLDLSAQTVLRMSPLLDARESLGHLHYFTRETALATLRDAGYRVVDDEFTQSAVDLWAGKSRVLRGPRRLAFRLSPRFAVRVLGGFSLLVLAEPNPQA
jgi:trans-aconitate methyltransferase